MNTTRFKGDRPYGGREFTRERNGPRVNRLIRVPEVRLIGSDGTQLGVFITVEALRRANEEGLDLVEISPMAKPPVCKIMDFGKYKYELNKKKHEQKRHQAVVKIKEIKLRPSTDEHDVETKINHIKNFLEKNIRVKVTLAFRGREMAYVDIGRSRMGYIKDAVKDFGEVEQDITLEGKFLRMFLVPVKK